ncbi:MAG: hypothetical protein JNL01_06835 [Bdellovibrionales bacterium]|nr:hypothetical protein [Bdellovibrionales bacterium]
MKIVDRKVSLDLAQEWLQRLSKARDFTVGVEHEFFLFTKKSKLASLAQSQAFLSALAQMPGWSVRGSGVEVGIERVSYQSVAGRYVAVKYEYAPHLMEVAFSYHESLLELQKEVTWVCSAMSKAADSVGLKMCNFDSIEGLVPQTLINLPLTSSGQALQKTRERLFRQSTVKVGEPGADVTKFPAFTAATQVHIGGLGREEIEDVVNTLYSYELEISCLVAFASYDFAYSMESLRRRWLRYYQVFSSLPLLGIPKVQNWTVQGWVDSLLSCPTLEGTQTTLDALISKAKDLQFIRPKAFGTIEFRASGAAKDGDGIVRVAEIRLALVKLARAKKLPSKDLSGQRERWLRFVERGLDLRLMDFDFVDEMLSILSSETADRLKVALEAMTAYEAKRVG